MLLLAALVRLLPWTSVFTGDHVRLKTDGDAYYHAFRAERIARDWPHVPWRDEGMNFPLGGDIPWPPLFDLLVATLARATGGAAPEHVAAVAALVPVALGLGVVVATAWIASALAGAAGWEAGFIVGLLLATVWQSFVGRADHHVLETLLYALAFAALAASLRPRTSRWPAAVLAVCVALSFWNWPGSAVTLVLLGSCLALMHLALGPVEGEAVQAATTTVALGALGAAGLLASSIPGFGPPGALRLLTLAPITGLSVVLCVVTACGAWLLGLARRLRPTARPLERLGHVAGTGSLLLVSLLVGPSPLRAGVLHGAMAINAANPWYRSIVEFSPMVFGGVSPWPVEVLSAAATLGLTPVMLVAAMWLVARGWHPGHGRAPIVLAVAWATVALAFAAARIRFEAYAALPLAIVAGAVAREGARRVARRAPRLGERRALVLALLVITGPSLPYIVSLPRAERPVGIVDKEALLSWLGGQPVTSGREGVLSPWFDGHEVRWLARRPVLSTPFGSELPRSLESAIAFLAQTDPARARLVLDTRRIGHLLLTNPLAEVATLSPLVRGARIPAVEERSVSEGRTYLTFDWFRDLVSARLYLRDGGGRPGEDALADYRLVGEGRSSQEAEGSTLPRYKLFAVVEGARIEVSGLSPGSGLRCTTRVSSNTGRRFSWSTSATADSKGLASCRVPYASGPNGLVSAEPYLLTGAASVAAVEVPEVAVSNGLVVSVSASR